MQFFYLVKKIIVKTLTMKKTKKNLENILEIHEIKRMIKRKIFTEIFRKKKTIQEDNMEQVDIRICLKRINKN